MLDFKAAFTERAQSAKKEYEHNLERLANNMTDELMKHVEQAKTVEEKTQVLVDKTKEQVDYINKHFADDLGAMSYLTDYLKEYSMRELVELK